MEDATPTDQDRTGREPDRAHAAAAIRNWVESLGLDYPRVQGPDGRKMGELWVWCQTHMDFDLTQAWLLEIDEPGPLGELYGQPVTSRVATQVAVICDSAHHSETLHITAAGQSYQRWPGTPASRDTARQGWVWFAEHVSDWFAARDAAETARAFAAAHRTAARNPAAAAG